MSVESAPPTGVPIAVKGVAPGDFIDLHFGDAPSVAVRLERDGLEVVIAGTEDLATIATLLSAASDAIAMSRGEKVSEVTVPEGVTLSVAVVVESTFVSFYDGDDGFTIAPCVDEGGLTISSVAEGIVSVTGAADAILVTDLVAAVEAMGAGS